jgi:hypothetical protein
MPNTTKRGGKMTAERAINPQKYARLLAKTLPSVIETEEENERLLNEVNKLMDKIISRRKKKSS